MMKNNYKDPYLFTYNILYPIICILRQNYLKNIDRCGHISICTLVPKISYHIMSLSLYIYKTNTKFRPSPNVIKHLHPRFPHFLVVASPLLFRLIVDHFHLSSLHLRHPPPVPSQMLRLQRP